MAMGMQSAVLLVQDLVAKGEHPRDQSNVLIVQLMGVRIIYGKIPAEVRKELNEAVKRGDLGHIKKDGLKKEAYHHKNARGSAIEAINRDYREQLEGLKGKFA